MDEEHGFEECLDYITKHKIDWMPIELNHKKVPMPVKLKPFKHPKKSDGKTTYVPHGIEFKTIDKQVLQKRQDTLDIYPAFNALGISTFKVFQLDIDTPHVNQEHLAVLKETFPYYKSFTKSYGYHFFFICRAYEPYATRMPLQPDNDFIQFEGNAGDVELLCGQWGYIKPHTKIHNSHLAPTEVPASILPSFAERKERHNPSVPMRGSSANNGDRRGLLPVNNNPDYHDDLIQQHLDNIDQPYFDNRDTHMKIVVALANARLYKSAYDAMKKSSMYSLSAEEYLATFGKRKKSIQELDSVFHQWKTSSMKDITISTFFYYSKVSNSQLFHTINKEFKSEHLQPDTKKDLFPQLTPTKLLDCRYLPKTLFNTFKDEKGVKEPQIIHVKSHLGTGKTTVIKHFIRKHPHLHCLYLAPRISFAHDIYASLEPIGFKLYSKIKPQKLLEESSAPIRIISQLESIHKFHSFIDKFDLVIIDEIESVLSNLTSHETVGKRTTSKLLYDTFARILQSTPWIVSLDAFLTQHSVHTINALTRNRCSGGDNGSISTVVVNTFQPYTRQATQLKGNKDLFPIACHQVLKKHEKIVVISQSKTSADSFLQYVADYVRLHNTKTPVIQYYYGNMDERKKTFSNVEEDWAKVDILLYTPIITCGVSYDPPTPTFHTLYILACAGSCVPRDVFQATLRVRKLIRNNCFFTIKKHSVQHVFAHSFEDVTEEIHTNNDLLHHHGCANAGEWATYNLAVKLCEQRTSQKHFTPVMLEYFRLCGYSILTEQPQSVEEDKIKISNGSTRFITNLVDRDTYEALETIPYDLTEQEKKQMKTFEYNQYFDAMTPIECLTKWSSKYQNVWLEYTVNDIDAFEKKTIESIIEDNHNQQSLDIFTNKNVYRLKAIKQLCSILGSRYSWETIWDSRTIEANGEALQSFLDEYRTFYKIRKPQQKETDTANKYYNCSTRYINNSIKTIFQDWLGAFGTTTKKKDLKINGERTQYAVHYMGEFWDKEMNNKLTPEVVAYCRKE